MADQDPASNPAPRSQPTGGAPKPTAAEAMAAESLRAAQEAVAGLRTETGPKSAADAEAAVHAAEAAIAQAQAASAAPLQGSARPGADASPLDLPTFSSAPASVPREGIDLLADVNLNVKIELGRTRMLVEDVLRLGEGSVVELDKLAGDPVDVYVNDRPVARGEVLVLNDNFCIRISEILINSGNDAA